MNLRKKIRGFFTLTRKANGGFTLVELIVVIAILAILAGVAVPAYSGYIKKANEAADQQLLAALNTAYAAACMENGEYDMTKLTTKPVASKIQEDVTIDPYNTSFKKYFGDGVFKYYTSLIFDPDMGVFVNAVSNFANAGVMEQMEQTLKGIGGYFSTAIGQGMTGDNLKTFLTGGMNSDLIDALGLNGMIDGYNDATTYTDEQLQEKYGPGLTAEQLTTLRGNLGMMYFAEDAAKRGTADVMNSVYDFIDIMVAAKDVEELEEADIENYLNNNWEAVEKYYLETHPGDATSYEGSDKAATLLEFLNNKEAIAINDDVKYSGIQAVAMAQAAGAEGMENTAGATTLSSMYALAAGYFNSPDYYNPETNGPRPSSYGDFESINKAMNNESFYEYIEAQGQADLEYYLDYMKSLSEKKDDLDLTQSDIFAGLTGQG